MLFYCWLDTTCFVAVENGDHMEKDKEWLFRENIRLKKFSDELERKEKALLEEQKNFELQKKALEIGFQKLAADKQQFEAEKREAAYQRTAEKAGKDHREGNGKILGPGFFSGITEKHALKKRYKELIKIYHPDNKNGDSFTVACITKEYEILKEELF